MTGWKIVARIPVEALQLLQKEKGDVEEEKKKTKKDKKEKEQQQEEQQQEEEEHAGQTGQYRGVSENDRHEILGVKCHSNKRCDWDV